MDIVRAVVVGVVHDQPGALRAKLWAGILIIPLPVEIPVPDPDQPFFLAGRQNCVTLHFLREVVRMRAYPKDVEIHRKHIGLLDSIAVGPCWNIQFEALQSDPERSIRGSPIGKIEPYGGLNELRFAGRVHVQLKDQIGVRAS